MPLRTHRDQAALDSYRTARQREAAYFSAQRRNRRLTRALIALAAVLAFVTLASSAASVWGG